MRDLIRSGLCAMFAISAAIASAGTDPQVDVNRYLAQHSGLGNDVPIIKAAIDILNAEMEVRLEYDQVVVLDSFDDYFKSGGYDKKCRRNMSFRPLFIKGGTIYVNRALVGLPEDHILRKEVGDLYAYDPTLVKQASYRWAIRIRRAAKRIEQMDDLDILTSERKIIDELETNKKFRLIWEEKVYLDDMIKDVRKGKRRLHSFSDCPSPNP